MKKLFIPVVSLLALGSLVGCSTNDEPTDYSDLNIACPQGAPALALYDIYSNSNVEINQNATEIAGYLSELSNKDIVFAPTNLVTSDAMKNGAPYKLAAVVTSGNFFIASTGNDDNGTLDKTDKVVLFQKGGLPDRLFKYVYGNDFENLYYTNNAANANASLISGKFSGETSTFDVDYVLVAQPALTVGLKKAKETRPDKADKIMVMNDVQQDYYTKTGDAAITQASIFVRNTDDKTKLKKINKFLEDTSNRVNALLSNKDNLDVLTNLEDLELQNNFGAPNLTILKKVVGENSLGLCYKGAKSEKKAIDKFLMNLGFTDKETNEDLYFD